MRRISDHQLHILSVVAKHERICIGLPVDAEWAPIAAELRTLAKWRFLVEEATDDGPAYTVSADGQAKLDL
ncbi:hypothetical protein WH87_00540 [Devosia epidermidihirudinis]|uniref:Uncharacterized protein n=1 Tax=Devosia epidermidihirudinis TaxID=1293439 RepID=A0A0F5QKD6_9HYPH|nr:hypothetical protein [Devosia epidermidihirudinis]KKC41472.1 hypothetical protein WH87_00540 [Devosia epidermidihirudinis]